MKKEWFNEPWVESLRNEVVKAGSQEKAGERIGYSAAVVNQVLKGSYTGNIEKVKAKVEGAFMGAVVDCPVIGEIPRNRCVDHQGKKFAATNPMRVQLHRSCPTCDHRQHRQTEETAA